MGFRDLDEFFRPSLKLPIRGKVYEVHSPDAVTGLWAQRLMSSATRAAKDENAELTEEQANSLMLDDQEEADLYKRLLGPAFQEMVDDGVNWEMLKHAGMTALIWAAGNTEAAETYWNNPDGLPETPTPKPSRRVSGSTTRTRASTSGTKSRSTKRKT